MGRGRHDAERWGSCRSHKEAARWLLASDWLAAHDAEVAARAIRGTADRWTQGAWADVMLPKPTWPAVPVIAYSNRVGDWLRARADALAASQGAGESGEGER
jgi:hypothetical protein